jgi:hypothetical protein
MQASIFPAAAAAVLCLAALPLAAQSPGEPAETRLIDDFAAPESAFGTAWEGIGDAVMGGKSELQVRILGQGEEARLRLSGRVSLENRGGFIQARLLLDPQKKPFAAGRYTGVALRVRGRERGYYVHLRTTRNLFPWSYYAQEFTVTGEWRTVYLPFRDFGAEGMRDVPINPDKLLSVAVVAYGREFFPDLEVDTIFFYR